jgi:hypothetical protein
MNDFLIFVAPILTLITSIILAFWAALKDKPIMEGEEK